MFYNVMAKKVDQIWALGTKQEPIAYTL